MKVLLWDVDSKIPNLTLMKLSTYHKDQGNEVVLKEGSEFGLESWEGFDVGFASVVFTWNADSLRRIRDNLPFKLKIGGSGWSDETLPDEVEDLMPDYGLYGCDFSMGFTSRGCIRRCEFCDVPFKEGPIREHKSVEEFHRPDHDKVLLLDNNFLASPIWEDTVEYLIDNELKVSICQGLDARLIGRPTARKLKRLYGWCGIYDHKFNDRAIYTAWDRVEDEEEVLTGIRSLLDVGFKPRYIRPYVLVGYNTTLEEDLYRFRKLRELGTYPFVMPYNNQDHPMKRWGQRPALYKSCSFEEYAREKGLEVNVPTVKI